MVKKINNIFVTGTMRSGGTLLCNMLNMHKDVFIIGDKLHFFRHIYYDYKYFSPRILFKIASELSIRFKYRFEIFIPKVKLFNFLIKKLIKNITQLNFSLLIFFSYKLKKKNVGEYANCEWRQIENFLNFNKRNIAIQIIRDPRAVLSSWKRITFSSGIKYLNAIFNWIDSIDYALKYKKKYPKRFMIVRFEDIHNDPMKISKKLCKFIGVRFDKNMISENKLKKVDFNKFNMTNNSGYNKKQKVFGFSKSRINKWKNHLYCWETCLIDFLCQERMSKMRYKINSSFNHENLKKGIKIIKKDKILKKRYQLLLKKNIGTDKRILNPKNPKTWEFKIYSSKKFSNTPIYKKYLEELKNNNRKILLYDNKF